MPLPWNYPVLCDENPDCVCDVPAPLTDFDGSRYMGTWYEAVHTLGMPFQNDSQTCITAQYRDLTDEGHFKVYNSGQPADLGSRSGIHGRVKCPDETGGCYVIFFTPYTDDPNYIVIDTDYESYSLVYSCHSAEYPVLWVLTREPYMPQAQYEGLLVRAAYLLPDFDFQKLGERTVEGDMCTYAPLPENYAALQ
jgi:lipocalin